MSDNFDDLFDAPASTSAATPAATVTLKVKAPLSEATKIWMPLFKPGSEVRYDNKPYTVSHVLISKGNLFVNLKEMEGAIPAEKVRVKLTEMTLNLPPKLANNS